MNDRISRQDMLMAMAFAVSQRSTCARAHVGVIVAIEARPLVSGYNGAPTGMPHCDHTCAEIDCTTLSYRDGQERLIHGPDCPAGFCKTAVHAEANAIAFAAKHGVCLDGSTLVTTVEPCYVCSQLIINGGIVEVVYAAPYRKHDGLVLLENAGVKTWRYQRP